VKPPEANIEKVLDKIEELKTESQPGRAELPHTPTNKERLAAIEAYGAAAGRTFKKGQKPAAKTQEPILALPEPQPEAGGKCKLASGDQLDDAVAVPKRVRRERRTTQGSQEEGRSAHSAENGGSIPTPATTDAPLTYHQKQNAIMNDGTLSDLQKKIALRDLMIESQPTPELQEQTRRRLRSPEEAKVEIAAEHRSKVETIKKALAGGNPVVLATYTRAWNLTKPEQFRVLDNGSVQVDTGARGKWLNVTEDLLNHMYGQAEGVVTIAETPHAKTKPAERPFYARVLGKKDGEEGAWHRVEDTSQLDERLLPKGYKDAKLILHRELNVGGDGKSKYGDQWVVSEAQTGMTVGREQSTPEAAINSALGRLKRYSPAEYGAAIKRQNEAIGVSPSYRKAEEPEPPKPEHAPEPKADTKKPEHHGIKRTLRVIVGRSGRRGGHSGAENAAIHAWYDAHPSSDRHPDGGDGEEPKSPEQIEAIKKALRHKARALSNAARDTMKGIKGRTPPSHAPHPIRLGHVRELRTGGVTRRTHTGKVRRF
jgi:hypothetical protein